MEKYNAILELMKSLEPDFEKFFAKGNKAAGTRDDLDSKSSILHRWGPLETAALLANLRIFLKI